MEPRPVPVQPQLAPPATNVLAVTNPPAVTPAVRPTPVTDTWVSLANWAARHGFGGAKRTAAVPPTYALTSGRGMLVVAAGNHSLRWNGMEVLLGFAPRLASNGLLVHRLDVEKNLDPLLADDPLPAAPHRVIVIDPGHGGTDTGTRSVTDGRFEKDFTLDWAKRLQPLLAAEGWTVFLTRTNDVNLPVTNRVAFAERHQADLFLSLHFNSAAPNPSPNGLETYALTPAGMPSNLTRGYEDDAALIFPNNTFDTQNLEYAVRLHRALLAVNGSPDRGVQRARFLAVLRGQHCPAVLIEGGYLSNPAEARKIADPRYRQKLAEAVAKALE